MFEITRYEQASEAYDVWQGSVEVCPVCFLPIPGGYNDTRDEGVQYCDTCRVYCCESCVEYAVPDRDYQGVWACVGCRETD